jgi:hypothetical protein
MRKKRMMTKKKTSSILIGLAALYRACSMFWMAWLLRLVIAYALLEILGEGCAPEYESEFKPIKLPSIRDADSCIFIGRSHRTDDL